MIAKSDTNTRPLSSNTTEPPRRPQLQRYEGRVVTVEATYSWKPMQLKDGRELHLLRKATVFPAATFKHVWLEGLPENAQQRLRRGTRFNFRARVTRYTRADGSEDYGLAFVEWVKE